MLNKEQMKRDKGDMIRGNIKSNTMVNSKTIDTNYHTFKEIIHEYEVLQDNDIVGKEMEQIELLDGTVQKLMRQEGSIGHM